MCSLSLHRSSAETFSLEGVEEKGAGRGPVNQVDVAVERQAHGPHPAHQLQLLRSTILSSHSPGPRPARMLRAVRFGAPRFSQEEVHLSALRRIEVKVCSQEQDPTASQLLVACKNMP
ncbi:unnamed protein product [Lota lota]